MPKFNFLNDYYQSRADTNNGSLLLNMYLEEDKNNGKYPVIALPSPGLSVFNSGTGSTVRCLFEQHNILYGIVDNTFYSYDSLGVRTSRGTLNTSTGTIGIDAISDQIMLVDGTNGYIYTISTNTFTTVTDPDFPANPIDVAAQDEFFVVIVEDSDVIYASDIADGTSWQALSIASSIGAGDYISALRSFKRQIWVFNEMTTEVWDNIGAPTFSFEANQSLFFHIGCAAVASVAYNTDSLFMLGQSKIGDLAVYMMVSSEGYTPKKISNRALDYQISLLSTTNDAIGYCYRIAGHEFYTLIFPTEGVSYEFDYTTGVWAERQSYISSAYTRYIGNCHAFCYGVNLVGDYQSGKIYSMSTEIYTENSAQILRKIITPPGYIQGYKTKFNKLQIDMQTNVGSSISPTVSLSKDSGATYRTLESRDIPASGGRMHWFRLGQTQDAFVVKFETTANAKVCVLGAVGEFEQGIN